MMGATKIQSQIRQFQQLDAATQNFITRYKQLPGDCTNCQFPGGGGSGQGDGLLDYYIGWGAATLCTIPSQGECYAFFYNLAQMGNLAHGDEYSYTTTPSGSGPSQFWRYVLNSNGNALGQSNVYYSFPNSVFNGPIFAMTATNGDLFWTLYDAKTVFDTNGLITPEQALAIDNKIDDGSPATGGFLPTSGSWGGCGTLPDNYPMYPVIGYSCTSPCVTGTKYNVANSGKVCALIVKSAIER